MDTLIQKSIGWVKNLSRVSKENLLTVYLQKTQIEKADDDSDGEDETAADAQQDEDEHVDGGHNGHEEERVGGEFRHRLQPGEDGHQAKGRSRALADLEAVLEANVEKRLTAWV